MAWIRGAICAQNTTTSVKEQTLKLFDEIVAKNNLNIDNIQAVFFTATKDIDVCYPAKFVRECYPQMSNVAFMCAQEMDVVGALARCIRVCVCVEGVSQGDVVHCYLDGAQNLRPDLK